MSSSSGQDSSGRLEAVAGSDDGEPTSATTATSSRQQQPAPDTHTAPSNSASAGSPAEMTPHAREIVRQSCQEFRHTDDTDVLETRFKWTVKELQKCGLTTTTQLAQRPFPWEARLPDELKQLLHQKAHCSGLGD